MGWLYACVDSPEPTQSAPTSTLNASTSTPTAQQTEISNTPETVEIADLRFIYRSITVELANVATADFDNDGHQDLISAGEPQITIFRGDDMADAAVASFHFSDVLVLLGGRGSIRTGYLPGGEHPWGMAVADFNKDGKDDLVISDNAAESATLYLSFDQ